MAWFERLTAWWRRVFGDGAEQPSGAGDAAKGDEASSATARPPDPGRPAASRPVPIRLALQGGGSHGAFTWGVLDRLLADGGPDIEAVSGASAGAMNAAVLACGWARGGRAGAREALAEFWGDVARADTSLQGPRAMSQALGLNALPGYDWGRSMMRMFSPYDFNPLNANPLRDIVSRHVDEDTLRTGPIRVFVNATSVRSGRPRVFSGDGLGIDALLASACLPYLFQAVEIDGEPYWDGGYSGNPSLYPLLEPDGGCDLVIVRITPARREGKPRSGPEIMDRVSEIAFNTSLIGELRAIALVNRALQAATPGSGSQVRLHEVADDDALAALPAQSRLQADRELLDRLAGYGRAAAERFLAAHGDALGRRSSLDVEAEFLPGG